MKEYSIGKKYTDFNIMGRTSNGYKLEKVKGKLIVFNAYPNLKFFLHQSDNWTRDKWSLSEYKSGFHIADKPTQAECIKEGMRRLLNQSKDEAELVKFIDKMVKKTLKSYSPANKC